MSNIQKHTVLATAQALGTVFGICVNVYTVSTRTGLVLVKIDRYACHAIWRRNTPHYYESEMLYVKLDGCSNDTMLNGDSQCYGRHTYTRTQYTHTNIQTSLCASVWIRVYLTFLCSIKFVHLPCIFTSNRF